jgi:hypothetical protein
MRTRRHRLSFVEAGFARATGATLIGSQFFFDRKGVEVWNLLRQGHPDKVFVAVLKLFLHKMN